MATPQMTVPTRCARCGETTNLPLVCIPCQAMNPDAKEDLDYFRLFGLEPGFEVSEPELYQKFVAMSRLVHPDLAEDQSEGGRQRSLAMSAMINRAYDTLRSPALRANYLLTLAGGPSPIENRNVPGELLGEVMMLREEMEEARASDDQATLKAMAGQVAVRRKATLERIEVLCRALDAKNEQQRKELREQLNALKYWDNLGEQLPETC